MTASPKFPQALAALPQWVCWRLEPDKRTGRDAKVPYDPNTNRRASASNPATWGTLAQALDCANKYHFNGVGFMFAEASMIVGIDIDNCLDENKKPNTTAAAILKKIPPTYIEISPSGRGLHIFLRGALPAGGNKNSTAGVEMYGKARYFTMTGNRWPGCADEIALDNGALSWIHTQFILKKAKAKQQKMICSPGFSSLPDDKIMDAARASKDGAVFDSLWRGDWQSKYKSQSEADFALCCKLAFWSNRDEIQIDRLFRQSGLFREKWDNRHSAGGATYGETTVERACETTSKTYTPPQKKPVNIMEQGGCYYRRKGEGYTQLTNFTVRPVEMVRGDDETQLTCEFVTDDGEVFRQSLLGEDMCSLPKFKKVLNKRTISLCFFGTEGDLEAFKDYLRMKEWTIKKGVKAGGAFYHRERFVYVMPEGAVAAGGEVVNTIVQMKPDPNALLSDICKVPPLSTDELLWLGQHLLSYNEPSRTVPVLAWCAGCFIKPYLRHVEAKYPHLFLIGESGSGKSCTLEKVILPIFSRKEVMGAPLASGFALMKQSASSNIIPQAIDEFKPSTIKQRYLNDLLNHFRDSFDGHDGIRGRQDQTTVRYPLLAPLVVSGEESADETAIRERTIELLFAKKAVNNPEYRTVFKKFLPQKKLLRGFGRSLLEVALSIEPSVVEQWYAEGEQRFEGDFPSRVTSNLACAYAGLMLIRELLGRQGLSWDGTFPLSLEACCGQLSYAVRQYLLDGGTHNQSIVEHTFEIMSRMNLKCGFHYTFEAAGRHLCIWFAKVYDMYTKHRKDYAIAGEVLTDRQFYKQLEHTEYYIAKQKPKTLDNVTRRVWVVDFEKLSQACDVAGFMQNDAPEIT